MNRAKVQNINYDKVVFLSLFAGSICLMLMYMYFVSASIVHVVIRKEISQDMVKMNSEISQLENQYIAAQHSVSNKIASLDGYKEVKDKVFIDRTHDNLAMSTVVGE